MNTTVLPAEPGPPTATAQGEAWQYAQGGWSLQLQGPAAGVHGAWRTLPPGLAAGSRVRFDAASLTSWDAALAAELWALCEGLRQRGIVIDTAGLPDGLAELLALAAPGDRPAFATSAAAPPAWRRALREARISIAFFGEVLIALWRWLRGRTVVGATDVLRQLDQTGPRSLPIVLLTCALVGTMLAYMGGAQLERIGAQGFLPGVVTVGMVRELAGLMMGVILAGRVGAAFAAQLATMQAGEEIDALRVLGVDPVAHLVLPRLLALLLMAPPLLALGALAGVAAGWLPAVAVFGLSSSEYLQQSLRALTATHLWIGLCKGLIYAALVALAGCREGLHAGRSAQAVGEATTAAVVKGLVWIVAAACASTVAFTAMGF